jgi:hypothetical protein
MERALYRSAPTAGAGLRSTRGWERVAGGCATWCPRSSSSRSPCAENQIAGARRVRRRRFREGIERGQKERTEVRLIPGRGAGRGGLAEEDANLLHAPGQARPPRHRCWMLASRFSPPAAACVIWGTGNSDRGEEQAVSFRVGPDPRRPFTGRWLVGSYMGMSTISNENSYLKMGLKMNVADPHLSNPRSMCWFILSFTSFMP